MYMESIWVSEAAWHNSTNSVRSVHPAFGSFRTQSWLNRENKIPGGKCPSRNLNRRPAGEQTHDLTSRAPPWGHTHTNTHTHTHIYIHTYIHTHTHITLRMEITPIRLFHSQFKWYTIFLFYLKYWPPCWIWDNIHVCSTIYILECVTNLSVVYESNNVTFLPKDASSFARQVMRNLFWKWNVYHTRILQTFTSRKFFFLLNN